MELNRENVKKLMLLITFTVVLLVGVQRMDVVLGTLHTVWNIFFPFVLGGALAFLLNVPMTSLEKHLFGKKGSRKKWEEKLARPLSLVLTLILVITVIALVIFVVVPELSATIVSLGKQFEMAIPRAMQWLEEIFRDNEQVTAWLNNVELDWKSMIETALGLLQTGATNVLSSTVSVAKGIISAVSTFVISFVFSCYILLQKEKLGAQSRKLLAAVFNDRQAELILHVCSLSHRTFSSFITGQCLEAVILGVMFFVSMTLLGFPYALLVGVLVAFTALIPIFGAFIGCAVGAFLILVVSPIQALAFIALFLVLQQVEGNLIYPYVVGGSIGLPSLWVLMAVTVGGSLMGIAGMLVFIPLTSVLYTLLREWVYRRLEEKKGPEQGKKEKSK